MPNDKLKQFYEAIKSNPNIEGLPNDYSKFESVLQDEVKSKAFFDAISQNENIEGLPKDYDTFANTLGLKKNESLQPSSQPYSEDSQTISKGEGRVSPLGEIKHAPNVANKPIMVGGQEPAKPKKEIPSIYGKIDIEQRPSSTATVTAKEKFTPTPTSEKIDENYKEVERIVDTSELEDLKERQLDQYTPTRSQGRDIKALVKEASKPMQPTASVESAKVEAAMMDLEADYLDYLQKTNPEMAEYQINKIEGIREKRRIGQTLNTSEEKELRDFRLSAIDAYDSAQRLKIKEIKLSSNFNAFNKGASALFIKIDGIDRQIRDLGINLNGQNPPDKTQKAQALFEQRNSLIDQLEALKQETGVTDEKMKIYSDAINNTIGQEAADYTVGLYGDLKALEEKNRKELEETAKRVLQGEEGVAKTIWKGYTGSIGTMATNILKLPKVIGDALGDNDYDAIDQMYYATDALQDRKQGMFGSVSSDDMPASYVYSRMFGEGLGSVVTFATPAGALGLTGKAANVAVGATAFATTEADYYKEALDLGMNPKEAARSATALAAITGAIESLVPDIELFNPTAFKRTVLQAVKEKGFKEGVKQAIENLPKKAQDIIATGNKEGVEELAGTTGEDLTKAAINVLSPRGDEYETFDPKSYTESYIGGFMVGGGLKVFSRPETAKKERSPLQEATLLDAVNLKDGVLEQAAAIDVEKTAEVETVINEAEEIYNALKGAPSFEKLPKNMQAHVLSELQRKKKLEQGLKTLGIEDASISNEIASIEEEVKFVLDNGQSRFDAKQAEMAKQVEPEVKAEVVELEPTVKEEVKVEPVVEEKVEPTLTEDKAEENVVVEPKVGDTVPLPPRIKGGQERTMVFTDQGWKQQVGDQVTEVNEATQKQAQEAFNLTAPPAAEKVEVTETVAPTKVESEESPINLEKNGTNEALKDVESTTKALEVLGKNKKTAATETNTKVVGDRIVDETNVNSETLGISQKISDGFTKAGEQSKIDKSPKALGEWIISNAQTGDRIIVDEDTYWVVERKTDKKGNTEIELQQYFRNENNVFENNPSAVKLFNSKHIGTETAKLATRDASDLFESSYRNNNGDVIVQQSKYISVSKNSKSISEAYHAAKADGSNPELVKAVEQLLGVEVSEKTESEESQKYESIKNSLPDSDYSDKESFEKDLKDGAWAFLTAENPDNKKYSEEENEKRNKEAEKWLESKGYKPQKVAGKYDRAENSYYVKGMSKSDAIAFANIFGQESVATNEGLYYQDGSFQKRVKGEERFGSADNYVSAIKIGGENVEFSIKYEDAKNTLQKAQEKVAGNKLFSKPLEDAFKVAVDYMKSIGKKKVTFKKVTNQNFNKDYARKIAKAFEEMKNDPSNKLVREAYEAMAKETMDQYNAIVEKGYSPEINNTEPYSSSEEMIADLRDNKRMKIFSTESGFGDTPITDQQRAENPLLRDSGVKDINGVPLLINDVFRFVHDFFGHAELGNGFGAVGEENAWRVHAGMYSPLARRAMTTETRGQNSWVNFSGVNDEAFSLRDKARALRGLGELEAAGIITEEVYGKMKFADQKIGLLPEEFSEISDSEIQSEESVSEEKPSSEKTEPAKDLEGKEAAKAKVDAVAARIKEALKAKGIEGIEVKKQGLGSDEIVDMVANGVKSMIDVGYAVKDAIDYMIEQVKDIVGDDADSVRDRLETMYANQVTEVFTAIEDAKRSKKSVANKQQEARKAAEKYGEVGKKAIFVDENFEDIVQSLIKDKKITRVCP